MTRTTQLREAIELQQLDLKQGERELERLAKLKTEYDRERAAIDAELRRKSITEDGAAEQLTALHRRMYDLAAPLLAKALERRDQARSAVDAFRPADSRFAAAIAAPQQVEALGAVFAKAQLKQLEPVAAEAAAASDWAKAHALSERVTTGKQPKDDPAIADRITATLDAMDAALRGELAAGATKLVQQQLARIAPLVFELCGRPLDVATRLTLARATLTEDVPQVHLLAQPAVFTLPTVTV
jgi:hypothetical protein